jgi:dihydrofolate synthase/folylpolyglutamate synthase
MVEWLYGLQHFGIKLGLHNIRTLLDLLGHPERAYRTVHVAGTNGKGSVAAMLDAMLLASGKLSGLFTSPHLVRPNERIRLAGEDIRDDELDSRLSAMRGVIEAARADGTLEAHPSFFEVITATALETFRRHELDAAVLEVGLGGRLDATNAVDADVGVVVSIGLDHVKTLGGTIEKIAAEKAGIVKPGMPVIGGVRQPEALEVLIRTCERVGAEWIDGRERIALEWGDGGTFTLRGNHGAYPDLTVGLAGPHQVDNARIAVAAFEELMQRFGETARADAVREGLARVRWPGRLQRIDRGAGQPAILLDGAHNPEGIRCVSEYLSDHPLGDGAVLLFGATRGKSLEALLQPLSKHCRSAVIGRPPIERGLEPEEVARAAEPFFDRVVTAPDTAGALSLAHAMAGEAGVIFVTGSLYLVGEVLGLLERRPVPGPVAM